MFRGAYSKKEIKGIVFLDSNYNNSKDNSEMGLKDVRVNLYWVKETDVLDGIRVLKESFVKDTKTDDKGEFRFYINEGKYSVNLDIETLPDGKGVVESDIFVSTVPKDDVNFIVRDIASIELDDHKDKKLFIGDEVLLNPVLRDGKSNILAGKIRYTSENVEVDLDNNKFRVRHRELGSKKVNINITAGGLTRGYPVGFEIPELATIDKIRLAFRSGIIDEETKVTLYLHTMFDNNRLSNEYRSKIPIKSGTTIMEEIKGYISRKNADRNLVETAKRYMSSAVPSLDSVYKSPGGFFKIHYTTTGANAVQTADANNNKIPDYVEAVGTAFDNVKSITCDSRGFRRPILDTGTDALDVYVYDLKGKYGITTSQNYYGGGKNGARKASCFISIDNNYSSSKGFKRNRDDCMKVTVAHEFFHAVQYAYNVDSDSWWKEASATWNEDEVYTGVNDYLQYLGSVFSSPEKSLEQNSYGEVVFAKYLSEKWGGYGMIKRIWEIQSSVYRNSLNSIDRAIKEKSPKEDIGTVYNSFTACNFNPSQYYKEGDLWNTSISMQNTYTAFPVNSKTGRLNHLAASYQLFKPAESGKSLKIIIEGSNGARWGFKIQKKRASDNQCDITEINIKGNYKRAEIICSSFGSTYKEVCLIPANIDKEVDGAAYSYSASII